MLEKIFQRPFFLLRHREAPMLDKEFDSWHIWLTRDSLCPTWDLSPRSCLSLLARLN